MPKGLSSRPLAPGRLLVARGHTKVNDAERLSTWLGDCACGTDGPQLVQGAAATQLQKLSGTVP